MSRDTLDAEYLLDYSPQEQAEYMAKRKAELPPGPWTQEPDLEEWDYHGVHCQIRRSHYFAWNGYVFIPSGHPWYGQTDEGMGFPEVHGGVTWTEFETLTDGGPEYLVVGFDCAHGYDLMPGMKSLPYTSGPEPEYRTIDYAREETETLAAQVLAAAGVAI
jgi:hypothetical protein